MTADDPDSKAKSGKRPGAGADKPASASAREPTGMSRRFATVEPVAEVAKSAPVTTGKSAAATGKPKKAT